MEMLEKRLQNLSTVFPVAGKYFHEEKRFSTPCDYLLFHPLLFGCFRQKKRKFRKVTPYSKYIRKVDKFLQECGNYVDMWSGCYE